MAGTHAADAQMRMWTEIRSSSRRVSARSISRDTSLFPCPLLSLSYKVTYAPHVGPCDLSVHLQNRFPLQPAIRLSYACWPRLLSWCFSLSSLSHPGWSPPTASWGPSPISRLSFRSHARSSSQRLGQWATRPSPLVPSRHTCLHVSEDTPQSARVSRSQCLGHLYRCQR